MADATNRKPGNGNGKATKKQSHTKGQFVKNDPRICRDGALKSKGRQAQLSWRKWLESVDPTDAEGRLRIDRLRDLLWEYATSGDKNGLEAVKIMFDRGYGKPRQSMELTGADGAALHITYSTQPPAPNAEQEAK